MPVLHVIAHYMCLLSLRLEKGLQEVMLQCEHTTIIRLVNAAIGQKEIVDFNLSLFVLFCLTPVAHWHCSSGIDSRQGTVSLRDVHFQFQ